MQYYFNRRGSSNAYNILRFNHGKLEFKNICHEFVGPVIFRFKKSNFPFQKKLNSVSIPFHYWQR